MQSGREESDLHTLTEPADVSGIKNTGAPSGTESNK